MSVHAIRRSPVARSELDSDREGPEHADARAINHRDEALAALADGRTAEAIAHLLAAIESRLDEQSHYIARLG